MDAAAANALLDILQRTRDTGEEWCGVIYQNPDGTFSYSRAKKGFTLDDGTKICKRPECPSNRTLVSDYHTHDKLMPDSTIKDDQFSDVDKRGARKGPIYLAVPSDESWMQKYTANPDKPFGGRFELLPMSPSDPIGALPNVNPTKPKP